MKIHIDTSPPAKDKQTSSSTSTNASKKQTGSTSGTSTTGAGTKKNTKTPSGQSGQTSPAPAAQPQAGIAPPAPPATPKPIPKKLPKESKATPEVAQARTRRSAILKQRQQREIGGQLSGPSRDTDPGAGFGPGSIPYLI